MALLGMALLGMAGCFGIRARFPAKAVWRCASHRTPYFGWAVPMHGVRWQSEARTPTPLWLGEGNSWSLRTPHGGGLMAMIRWRC